MYKMIVGLGHVCLTLGYMDVSVGIYRGLPKDSWHRTNFIANLFV